MKVKAVLLSTACLLLGLLIGMIAGGKSANAGGVCSTTDMREYYVTTNESGSKVFYWDLSTNPHRQSRKVIIQDANNKTVEEVELQFVK
jgi:hypothetical protein